MSATGFDVVAHHRTRTRRAEGRAGMFERENARLIRLLVLALQVATRNGWDAEPQALLRVLEELDEAFQRPQSGLSDDEFARLLVETDPDRIGRAAA